MVELKNCHIYAKIPPKMVNPTDIARNTEEEEDWINGSLSAT